MLHTIRKMLLVGTNQSAIVNDVLVEIDQ